MNRRNIPQHVFISYSRNNSNFVEQLAADLRSAGINTWIDDKGLTPGTPDWESAIRDAIDSSFAILLLATPDSRQSVHVKGEINIAQARGIPIYPIWSVEDTWIDCIPLSMSNTQYIDCRPSNYSTGLATIVDRLRSIADSVIPQHYLIKPLTKIVDSYGYKQHQRVPIPLGYVCIELPFSEQEDEVRAGVVMKVNAYPSFLSLLDDLYIHYLRERFKPFTYGRDWLLETRYEWKGAVFALPFSWLKLSDKRQFDLDHTWAMSNSPEAVGLIPNSHWFIRDTPVERASGLLINDRRLTWIILTNPKAEYSLLRRGYLEEISIDAANPDEYKYAVVAYWDSVRRRADESLIIRQTNNPLDEEEMKYRIRHMRN